MQIDDKLQGRINRSRNIPFFKGMSDSEIAEHLLRKDEEKKGKMVPTKPGKTYEERFNKLFDALRAEYGVDMNDSNDAEALKNLVRHTLQLEGIDQEIIKMQENGMSFDDTRSYKNLADVQRSIIMSITDLQDRLGISRKARKEKAADDVPQFVEGLKKKAAEFWQRKTVPIKCNKCEIELGRYWLNFPSMKNKVSLELQCWKCQETVVYVAG